MFNRKNQKWCEHTTDTSSWFSLVFVFLIFKFWFGKSGTDKLSIDFFFFGMCLAYVKPEVSRLGMPLVHIAASTAVICSRNGSKCFYHGGKLSHFFPLYCPINPVAYTPSLGCRRHSCQVSG